MWVALVAKQCTDGNPLSISCEHVDLQSRKKKTIVRKSGGSGTSWDDWTLLAASSNIKMKRWWKEN